MKKTLHILHRIGMTALLVLAIAAAFLIILLDKHTSYRKFRDKTR